MRSVLCLVAAALLVVGCAGPAPTAAPTLGPNQYVLPSDPGMVLGPDETPRACAGVGLDAVLVASASDPRKVWLDDAITGGRIELVWPPGFTVRFGEGTAFDVLNAAGKVAIVGGSHVSGACVGADAYWLDTVFQ
jgi:hypothetical protein